MFGERAQPAGNLVAARGKADADGVIFELLMERTGVEIAGAFVERIGHQVGEARLVGRNLCRAVAKCKVDGDERQARFAYQPRLDAAGTDDALNVGCGLRGRSDRADDGKPCQHADLKECTHRDGGRPLGCKNCHHDFFSFLSSAVRASAGFGHSFTR